MIVETMEELDKMLNSVEQRLVYLDNLGLDYEGLKDLKTAIEIRVRNIEHEKRKEKGNETVGCYYKRVSDDEEYELQILHITKYNYGEIFEVAVFSLDKDGSFYFELDDYFEFEEDKFEEITEKEFINTIKNSCENIAKEYVRDMSYIKESE